MKAITIWEPYASAIAKGIKKFETRSWKTNYRGTIAIHASLKKINNKHLILAKQCKIEDLKYGTIVAIAEITDCIFMTKQFISTQTPLERQLGNWTEGNYAWKLENIRVVNSTLLIRGK